jgi:O-antigen/teichoic acid export membrane protein
LTTLTKQPHVKSEATATGKRRTVRWALFANWYGLLVNATTQIAVVPFFLTAWSKEIYGDWMILFSLPAVLMLADFGIGSVTANHISMAMGRKDRQAARAALQSGFVLVMAIGLIALVAISALAEFSDMRGMFGISKMNPGQARTVLLLFGLLIAIWMQLPLLLGVFQGNDAFAFGSFITTSVRLGLVPLTIVPLLFKASPIGVAMSIVIGQAVAYLAMNVWCWYRYPDLRYGTTLISKSLCFQLIREGTTSFGITVGTMVTNYGPILVVGHLLGSGDVVAFTVIRTLSRVGALLASCTRSALIPEFSYLYGARDVAGLRRLMRVATVRILIAASIITAGLIAFGREVISSWTKHAVTVSLGLLTVFALCSLIQSLSSIPGGVVFSTNKTRFISFGLLASSVTAIALSACFSPFFGLVGVGMALIVGEIMGLIVTFVAMVKLFREQEIH